MFFSTALTSHFTASQKNCKMNGQKEVGEEMGEKNLIEKTWHGA